MKSEKLTVGLLAHVDAGKTTLAESLLYQSGAIRKAGRVDHRDTYLDHNEQERARGITIFSKQAELTLSDGSGKQQAITLLDTPGHVDFSAEMERTLQVLDYAILVISGADGVQGHVETLWKLLQRYQVPVFLFVNKMDQPGCDVTALMAELKKRLSDNCVFFGGWSDGKVLPRREEEWQESIALCEEQTMEQYLEYGCVKTEQVAQLVANRRLFPCFFGSALKMQGLETLVQGFLTYSIRKQYPDIFGARVYKISRDSQGNRLTHMKITGGSLKVKTVLKGPESTWEEKADQLRICSGDSFSLCQEVSAGAVCAVTGLTKTFAGEGLGAQADVNLPVLSPVLTYRLLVPEGCNLHAFMGQLRQLEEEEPLLHILWQQETGEIHLQLMGEVQTEILKAVIRERFGVAVEFGPGSIVYRETIASPVEGVGHFEPLRHYAEVHLLLEPGKRGSGLIFDTDCSEDVLDRNWQRLILTHLREKQHRGVLTGSEITDMKITLIAGRAHPKHTEGGDFRQATYRAVRQGLKMGECHLLEPVFQFRLEVPGDSVGRAMSDIQRMSGTFEGPFAEGEMSVLQGSAPVSTMQGYQTQVLSYTGGKGRLSCSVSGYELCHNEDEIISAAGYDSEADPENPTGSVFCAHGAGFVVNYREVYDYMHLEGRLAGAGRGERSGYAGAGMQATVYSGAESAKDSGYDAGYRETKELEEIFRRTYGDVKQERRGWTKARGNAKEVRTYRGGGDPKYTAPPKDAKEYLLVDGYNIIFGWPSLAQLAKRNMAAARDRLMDILCNYQGYKQNVLILVFDAYKVEGNPGSSCRYHNIHVVYTKEAETADQYIEKVTHEIGKKHRVTVATSDGLEQVIILGQGAVRMSAQGLYQEIQTANEKIREDLEEKKAGSIHNYLLDYLPKE